MSTKIEWCEESWNPITGCSPVSEGCEHCYARRMAQRLKGRYGYPQDDPFKVTFHPDRMRQPLKWKKPRHIFVVSMGDLFHEDVNSDLILRVLMVVRECSQHIFLILTKRPQRMYDFCRYWFSEAEALADMSLQVKPIPKNLWLGCTAENQQRADERIPILLQIPAAKYFVSIEPMLSSIDLSRWLPRIPDVYAPCYWCDGKGYVETLGDHAGGLDCPICKGKKAIARQTLDWVIVGGESGPGARPMHPDWPRSVRDQCQEAGVPFFFKQWGEWFPGGEKTTEYDWKVSDPKRIYLWENDADISFKIGKKAAGRLLDGQEWNEVPE